MLFEHCKIPTWILIGWHLLTILHDNKCCNKQFPAGKLEIVFSHDHPKSVGCLSNLSFFVPHAHTHKPMGSLWVTKNKTRIIHPLHPGRQLSHFWERIHFFHFQMEMMQLNSRSDKQKKILERPKKRDAKWYHDEGAIMNQMRKKTKCSVQKSKGRQFYWRGEESEQVRWQVRETDE